MTLFDPGNASRSNNVAVTARFGIAAAFGGLLLVSTSAWAFKDSAVILSGGLNSADGFTTFVAPGTSNPVSANNPTPSFGAQAAQIKLPAGELSQLRLHVTTQSEPSSGTLELAVFVNGVQSKLKCSLAGTGDCKTKNSKKVTLANNAGVGVRVKNEFVDAGLTVVTFSLVYD